MILHSNISDQTMLHSELSAFVTEIEGEKIIFQQGDAPIHTTATTKKWFLVSRFRNRIIVMVGIEFRSERIKSA